MNILYLDLKFNKSKKKNYTFNKKVGHESKLQNTVAFEWMHDLW